MHDQDLKSVSSSGTDAAVKREELHLRQIEIRGFQRSDGLLEVEGRVIDRRTHDQKPMLGRAVPAGTPLHDMGVRLVFDEDLVVHDIHTFTDAAPYAACPSGGLVLKNLKGVRMTSGWNKEVRSRIEKARSCTHLVELLSQLATVAFQSVSASRQGGAKVFNANDRPNQIDSCYAYAADGELVRQRWPDFFQETPSKE